LELILSDAKQFNNLKLNFGEKKWILDQ
jgi:hypothetical protein